MRRKLGGWVGPLLGLLASLAVACWLTGDKSETPWQMLSRVFAVVGLFAVLAWWVCRPPRLPPDPPAGDESGEDYPRIRAS